MADAKIRLETPNGGMDLGDADAGVFILHRAEGPKIGTKIAIYLAEDCDGFSERTALLAVLHPLADRIIQIGVCGDPSCEGCLSGIRVAKEIQAICSREEGGDTPAGEKLH